MAWEWNADNHYNIWSSDSSGAQRLKNGNTLITFGTSGNFIEVTPDQEVVWKYNGIVHKLNGLLCYNGDPGEGMKGPDSTMVNVFKVREFELDYSGFAGKDLTPIADSIELYGDCGELDGPAHLD